MDEPSRMDSSGEGNPPGDGNRSHITDGIKDGPDDLEFILPPYPEDLPSPLGDGESITPSAVTGILSIDMNKSLVTSSDVSIHSEALDIGTAQWASLTPDDMKKSSSGDLPSYRGLNTSPLVRTPNGSDVSPCEYNNGKIRSENSGRNNLSAERLNTTDKIGDQYKMSPSSKTSSRSSNAAGSNSDGSLERRSLPSSETSPQETTNVFRAEQDLNLDIQGKTGNVVNESPVSEPESTTSQERSLVPGPKAEDSPASDMTSPDRNKAFLKHQDSKSNVLVSGIQETNELWPPVPNMESVVSDMKEDSRSLQFQMDNVQSELSPGDRSPLTNATTIGIERNGGTKTNEKIQGQLTTHTPEIGSLPKNQSMERVLENGKNGGSFETQKNHTIDGLSNTSATVEHKEQQPFVPGGVRDFTIPLATYNPEMYAQDLGQRRRERYAHSKSPFWKESSEGNTGPRKAETPMAISPFSDNPYEVAAAGQPQSLAASQDFGSGLSQNASQDFEQSQPARRYPSDDAAIITNDIIIIRVPGGDQNRRTEEKLAEIVQELSRLSSTEDVNGRGREPRIGGSVDKLSKTSSLLNMELCDPHSRNDPMVRSAGNGTTPRSATRISPLVGRAPLRHGTSVQHDFLTQGRPDFKNIHGHFASSSLDRLETRASRNQKFKPQDTNTHDASPSPQGAPYSNMAYASSVEPSPSSEHPIDSPKLVANHKVLQYERFDVKKERPHSAESPATQKIMKFLNLTNGTGDDIESKILASGRQNGSLEQMKDSQRSISSNEKEHSSNSTLEGKTNDAFEPESHLSGDDLEELLRISGKGVTAMSASSTVDSAEDPDTPDETTPLYSNAHRRQRSVAFFDEISKDKAADFDSIYEEGDEGESPQRQIGQAELVFTDDYLQEDDPQEGDDFMNEEYDNLSLEFVVPGSKKHIRLHRETFINFILKYSIFLFSFMFWSASLSGCGFATWMLTRQTVAFDNASDVMLDPYVLLCLVGGIIFLVAFLGCIGALRENILLLRMFHVSLTAVLALEMFITALIFIFYTLPEFRRAAKVGPEEILKKAVIRYFDDDNMRRWIDNLQEEFKCCGVSLSDEGYLDWAENQYFNCSQSNPSIYRCSVPLSCCIFEPGDYINYMCGIGIISKDMSFVKRYINTKGCMKSFGEWLGANMAVIAYVGMAFIIPQILGVIAARIFIKNLIKKRDRPKEDDIEIDDEDYSDVEETPPLPASSFASAGMAAVAVAAASSSASVALPGGSDEAQTGV